MASYADQLRERLAQITGMNEAATTWEQLKRQREAQRRATMEALGFINSQTDAYRQQLSNYASMYNSGKVVRPATPSIPSGSQTKKRKKKSGGSLGDALGGFADSIGGIF